MAARSSIRSAFVVAVSVFMACWCALDARAQSIVGWGSENYRNVDNLDGNIVKVAAGGYHTVALKADGSIACWGSNGYGQCNVPAGLGAVQSVAAGYGHTVALKHDGSVACWGNNSYAQYTGYPLNLDKWPGEALVFPRDLITNAVAAAKKARTSATCSMISSAVTN